MTDPNDIAGRIEQSRLAAIRRRENRRLQVLQTPKSAFDTIFQGVNIEFELVTAKLISVKTEHSNQDALGKFISSKFSSSCWYEHKRGSYVLRVEQYSNFIIAAKQIGAKCSELPSSVVKVFCQMLATNDSTSLSLNKDLLGPMLQTSLLPFQYDSVSFALQQGGRAIIADEPGLGKTIQSLAVISQYISEVNKSYCLVVTPKSLAAQWMCEAKKFLPQFCNNIYNLTEESYSQCIGRSTLGSNALKNSATLPQALRKCQAKLRSSKRNHNVLDYDLHPPLIQIGTYELVNKLTSRKRSAKDSFSVNVTLPWSIVVVDESHYIKNYAAERTRSIIRLCHSAKHVILLTGTPAVSRPIELYTQLNAVRPDIFPMQRYTQYGFRYCAGVVKPFGNDFRGASHLNELHLLLRRAVMIRRLKKDVLNQMPDKTRKFVMLAQSDAASGISRKPAVIDTYSRLTSRKKLDSTSILVDFQKACDRKMPSVVQYLNDYMSIPTGSDDETETRPTFEKCVVFGHHSKMLDALEECVQSRNVSYIRIDGSTSSKRRDECCQSFSTDPSVRVAILSLTAASTGLNLVAATRCIFAELFWNPGTLLQAEDRIHRIGQTRNVEIIYLVYENSVDSFLMDAIDRKLGVLNVVGLSAGKALERCGSINSSVEQQSKSIDKQSVLDRWLSTAEQLFSQKYPEAANQEFRLGRPTNDTDPSCGLDSSQDDIVDLATINHETGPTCEQESDEIDDAEFLQMSEQLL